MNLKVKLITLLLFTSVFSHAQMSYEDMIFYSNVASCRATIQTSKQTLDMSVNKVILLGNVGQDPDVRVAGEHKVATFSLATTERGYTLQNGTQVPERTEWHNIVLWRGLAEIAEKYVHKGDKLYIEGKIKTRSYEDKSGVSDISRRYSLTTLKCLEVSHRVTLTNLNKLKSKREQKSFNNSNQMMGCRFNVGL